MTTTRSLAAVALLLAGCGGSTAPAGSCSSDADCTAGAYCAQSFCVVDDTPPVLTVTSPTAAQFVSTATFVIDGTASDGEGSGVISVEYSLDGSTFTAATLSGGKFTASAATPMVDGKSLTLSVRATDRSGNVAKTTVDVVADRVAPVIVLTQPAEVLLSKKFLGQIVKISGKVTDGSKITRLELSSDGGKTWAAQPETTSFEVAIDVQTSASRVVTLQARATDAAGNVSTPVVARDLLIDTVEPLLSIDSPVDSLTLTLKDPASLQVSGKCSDANLAALTSALDSAAPVKVMVSAGEYSFALPLANENGMAHVLKLTAIDAAGNEVTLSRKFTVDRQAPLLRITAPVPQSVFNLASPATLTITGIVDDVDLAKFEMVRDGGAPFTLPGGGTFSVPVTLDAEELQSHSVTVNAVDKAGNPSSATTSYIVDRVAPVLSVTSPADGALFSLADPATLTVTGTVKDADLSDTTLSLDGGAAVSVNSVASGAWTFSIPLAREDGKSHAFTVTAIDNSGNKTMVTRTFAVDRVPPVITLTTPSADGSCIGVTCSGAVVNMASTGLAFSGAVSDGGGLKATGAVTTSVAGGASTDAQLSGGTWSTTWSAFPASAGALFELTAVATDKAGNTATAKRKIWVDRVAPTFTMLVDQKRLISRTADLLRFSEEMDAPSVTFATTFSPALLQQQYGTADTRSFGLINPVGFEPYRTYSLTLGTGAKDKAGNPLAAGGSEQFLTEIVAPPTLSPVVTGSAPSIAVDVDAKPVVLAWAGTRMVLSRWDGRGAWEHVDVPGPTGLDTPCDTASSILLTSNVGSNLALDVKIELAACAWKAGTSPPNATVWYAATSDFAAFAGAYNAVNTFDVVDVNAAPDGSPSLTLSCPAFSSCTRTIQYMRLVAIKNEVYRATSSGTPWALASYYNAAAPSALSVDAVIGGGAVQWLAGTSPISTGLPGTATFTPKRLAGLNALKGTPSQIGSSYLFLSGTTTAGTSGFMACALNSRQAASWLAAPVTLLTTGAVKTSAMALSASEVAVAIGTDVDEIMVARQPNTTCGGAPSTPSWGTPIRNARQPSLTTTRGVLYGVFVDTTSGQVRMMP